MNQGRIFTFANFGCVVVIYVPLGLFKALPITHGYNIQHYLMEVPRPTTRFQITYYWSVKRFATGSCALTTSRWCKASLPKALDYCSHDTHVSLTSPCTDREAQQSTKCLDCVCELLPLHVWIEKRTSQLIILTVFATSRMRHAIIRLVALIMYCDRVSYVGLTRGNWAVRLDWTTKSKLTVEPHNVGGDTR